MRRMNVRGCVQVSAYLMWFRRRSITWGSSTRWARQTRTAERSVVRGASSRVVEGLVGVASSVRPPATRPFGVEALFHLDFSSREKW